jgi:hypothetical protein
MIRSWSIAPALSVIASVVARRYQSKVSGSPRRAQKGVSIVSEVVRVLLRLMPRCRIGRQLMHMTDVRASQLGRPRRRRPASAC